MMLSINSNVQPCFGLGRRLLQHATTPTCAPVRAAATRCSQRLLPPTRSVVLPPPAATYPRGGALPMDQSPSSQNAGDSGPEDSVAGRALQEYFALQSSGVMDSSSLDKFRLRYNMRRTVDGRAELRRRNGDWMQIKLDNEVKGTMLLRDSASNWIYVLQTEALEQIDLSDDYLLLMLFADASWEDDMMPIQLTSSDGTVETLELQAQQFKDFVGLLRTLQDMSDNVAGTEQQQPGTAATAAAQQQQSSPSPPQQQQQPPLQQDSDGTIDVTPEPVR